MSVLALLKQRCYFQGSKKNVPLLSKIILQLLFFANLSLKLAKTIQGMPKYLEYMYLDGARGFPLVSKTFPGFRSLGVQNIIL